MKITQEQADLVADLIARGEDAGEGTVYVDVLQIGERFGVTWPVAMKIMRRAAKQLGHDVVGRNVVSKTASHVPPVKCTASPLDRILEAAAGVVREYDKNPSDR